MKVLGWQHRNQALTWVGGRWGSLAPGWDSAPTWEGLGPSQAQLHSGFVKTDLVWSYLACGELLLFVFLKKKKKSKKGMSQGFQISSCEAFCLVNSDVPTGCLP